MREVTFEIPAPGIIRTCAHAIGVNEKLDAIIDLLQNGGSGIVPPQPPTEWQPQPDWWDIEAIFNADPDPNKRFILLLTDSLDTFVLDSSQLGNSNAYYKTSDGVTYNDEGYYTHNWNKEEDKPCALGYKTRYVTVYSTNRVVTCDVANENNRYVKYAYFGDCTVSSMLFGTRYTSPIYSNRLLESIKVSNETLGGINAIGDDAFWGCYSLSQINIPQGVKYIRSYAFSGCYSLSQINIPQSIRYIGDYAFGNCSSLTQINIPQSVISVGTGAFHNCHSLAQIDIPQGVVSIGGFAFSCCFSLTQINIPQGIERIEDNTFYNCHSLSQINLPQSITSIGDYAFYNCRSLAQIDIPQLTVSIGAFACQQCCSLSRITIPQSVEYIGYGAFLACSSLLSLQAADGWVAPEFGLVQYYWEATELLFPESAAIELFTRLGESQTPVTLTFGYLLNRWSWDTIMIALNKGYSLS